MKNLFFIVDINVSDTFYGCILTQLIEHHSSFSSLDING